MIDFSKFIGQYPPSSNLIKADGNTISFFEDKLPADLISFWKEYGFGNFGKGIIKFINPEMYAENLAVWLGRANDWSRIPILVSGFGDIFYYRRITETDEDVSVVDLHFRRITVCTDYVSYSLQFFFEDYITNQINLEHITRKKLFDAAIQKRGELLADEIFMFAPALILGGAEEIKYIEKGNAQVHQQLLFQMGS